MEASLPETYSGMEALLHTTSDLDKKIETPRTLTLRLFPSGPGQAILFVKRRTQSHPAGAASEMEYP